MQNIIDTEFRNVTVLAIMHRLEHVESYDKVAVLHDGRIVEYDHTARLLSTESALARLCEASTRS